ncbi:MAG: secretion protein HylD [Burkholderiaceae bacterium]|nr:secretion protein HylD [Burkholderiaceae bacterium]
MPRWPALREELRLHHGPADAAGQPTWTVQDPVRHRFLRIDWTTHEILRHWWLGNPALIAQQVNSRSTLAVDADDVLEVLRLALREELVHAPQPPAAAKRPETRDARDALRWLLHHYLFFRVPLWRPDRLLERLLPWTAWLGSSGFTRLTLVVLVAGLLGLTQQSEALGAQWLDLLSWRGIALYAGTLVLVKLAHELGHALVARHAGCRVPTMGIALMVLWPMAYTDTTEAWRLSDARARARIAAAGVRTELTLAAWATLAWCWLPDGALRTAMFVLATMTWIGTVLINLSPFMRFDGYFLLCDALDQPNLHERSFALARCWLRRTLLGWNVEPPETLSPRAHRAMLLFAFATWAYRLALYLGIAWMVYQLGFKALGLLLAAVELGWFVFGPVARELRTWHAGRAHWFGARRARWSVALLAALGAAGALPWQHTVSAAALLQPAQHLALRLPAAVTIDAVPVVVGQHVRAGQPLLRTSAPVLQQQRDTARARVAQLERELAAAALGIEQQAQWGSLQAALATAREQAEAAREETARFQPLAPFDGVVVGIHPDLRADAVSPPPSEVLLHLAVAEQWRAVAYGDEATARVRRTADRALLGVDAAPLQRWPARVASVAPHPSARLAEPILAQAHGGLVDARQADTGWLPVQAIYRVELELEESPALSGRTWRGHAVFAGEALSTWQRLWRATAAVWVREAGF